MMKLAAFAAALLVTCGAASAQSATEARCILLANAFAAQSKDATSKSSPRTRSISISGGSPASRLPRR